MSDHDPPPEPGLDRAYLSSVMILIGILLAVFWSRGTAAPKPRKTPQPGPRGVVVLRSAPGTPAPRFYGTVIERGDTVQVIDAAGRVHMFPSGDVAYRNTESDELETTKKAPAKRREVGGQVILKSGEVLIGRVTVTKDGLIIRWPFGAKKRKGEVHIPRGEIRSWTPIDAKKDERTGRAPRRQEKPRPERVDDRQLEAEEALQQERWQDAARMFAGLYRTRGLKTHHLQNLRKSCARMLYRLDPLPAHDSVVSEARRRLKMIQELRRWCDGINHRAEIRKLQVDALRDLSAAAGRLGLLQVARQASNELGKLGS